MSSKKQMHHLVHKKRHPSALLSNLGKSLITHKKIITTHAKAKALRRYIEPILTKAKIDNQHSRRRIFAHFQDKKIVKELFNNVAPKIATRPGGYINITQIDKVRLGDGAHQALIELVDCRDLPQQTAQENKT